MKAGSRRLLSWLIVVAFAAAQWGAHFHGVSHLRHDLSVAELAARLAHAHANHGDGAADVASHHDHAHDHDHDHFLTLAGSEPPPLDHEAELCLVFHALDCKATAPPAIFADVAPPVSVAVGADPEGLHLPVAVSYLSRAPPIRIS
jgi:hypothetical protein